MEASWRNKDDKRQHDWLYVSVLLLTIFIYTITVGFNVLPSGSSLIPNDISLLSSTIFILDITPGGWTFVTIWSLIFIFQFAWLIYNLVCIFRKTSDGFFLYRAVDFLPLEALIAFMVNNLMVITWLFLFANKYAGWALIPIVFATFALHVMLFISLRNLHRNKKALEDLGLKIDLWLVRILVHDSLGLYLTWMSIASNINFAIFLVYNAGCDLTASGSITLVIILLTTIVYFILENFVWQRYLLYIFSPWFVVIVALAGIIGQNWQASSPTGNNIFTMLIFVVAICFAITKVVFFVLYHTIFKDRLEGIFLRKNKVHNAEIEIDNVPEIKSAISNASEQTEVRARDVEIDAIREEQEAAVDQITPYPAVTKKKSAMSVKSSF